MTHAWQVPSPAAACTWLLVDRQSLSLSPATIHLPCAGYMSVVFFSTSLPGNPVYAVDLRTLQEVSPKDAPSAANIGRLGLWAACDMLMRLAPDLVQGSSGILP